MASRYDLILERIFLPRYARGEPDAPFGRAELDQAADEIGIVRIKNLGDALYSATYRAGLPASIEATAPEGMMWIIHKEAKGQYRFMLIPDRPITPNTMLMRIKVPDATPSIVKRYASRDEQSLLAQLRYNRLIDIFTGVTCYSLQYHLRTTIRRGVQIETDEVYVGVNKRGVQFVFPVQAKGGSDRLHVVQIEQDSTACALKYPDLICRPIGAQFIADGSVALFEFGTEGQDIRVVEERHYLLVPAEEVQAVDLETYRNRESGDGGAA